MWGSKASAFSMSVQVLIHELEFAFTLTLGENVTNRILSFLDVD